MLIASLLSLSNRKTQRVSLILLIPLMIIMIGFRYKIGGDWYAYEAMLSLIKGLQNPILSLTATDPAYGLINYFAPTWWYGNGISFVNTICATLFLLGVAFFSHKQMYPMLCVAIAVPYLILVVGMGYTRQSAAIGMALMAYYFLIDGRLKLYLFFVLFGALFHLTEVVM